MWACAYVSGYWGSSGEPRRGSGLFPRGTNLFWREGRKQESRADYIASHHVWQLGPDLRGDGFSAAPGLSARETTCSRSRGCRSFSPAILMVMARLRGRAPARRAQYARALESKNLATSGVVGGEIHKMLAQALDPRPECRSDSRRCSLSESRRRKRYGFRGCDGPEQRLCVTPFRKANSTNIRSASLRAFGGLVVLRNLTSDSEYRGLEKEDAFRQVRQLLLKEDLCTVVGISLQAKEHTFGVLLLATPDSRDFTPAELRLLLALGHQIGMAVENSLLIQQTSRRTEELHILNEIGRALSSTLDLDTLLTRIYSEMRRVLDVSSFFIAFYDHKTEEVRFPKSKWWTASGCPSARGPSATIW